MNFSAKLGLVLFKGGVDFPQIDESKLQYELVCSRGGNDSPWLDESKMRCKNLNWLEHQSWMDQRHIRKIQYENVLLVTVAWVAVDSSATPDGNFVY